MTPHLAVDLRPGFFGLTRVARLVHRVVDASDAAGHGLGDARYYGSGRQVRLSPDWADTPATGVLALK